VKHTVLSIESSFFVSENHNSNFLNSRIWVTFYGILESTINTQWSRTEFENCLLATYRERGIDCTVALCSLGQAQDPELISTTFSLILSREVKTHDFR
jgi:hypothetical protein